MGGLRGFRGLRATFSVTFHSGKVTKTAHSKRGDGSTPTTAKTTISASLRRPLLFRRGGLTPHTICATPIIGG